jgi:3-deoxy-D-manno-octulosonic-acid transferase
MGPTVWIHAASLGECKLLCRFVRLLELRHPGAAYVATTVTRTGLGYLRLHAPENVTVLGLLPLDTVGRMRRMLRRFRVERLWLLETELWPSMLWACLHEGVPVGIANARMESGPRDRYRSLAVLFAPLLGSLDVVLAQDQCYADRYCSLGVDARRVRVVGNLKSHVTIALTPARQRDILRAALGIGPGETVLTVGCAHPGEGRVVRGALSCLRADGRGVRCLVVPRHREAVPVLCRELGDALVLQKSESVDTSWTVALVDQYGVLDDMYSLADVALVGGTFVDVGGHNVWDAAQFGIPVLFGPHHHAQARSCETLLAARVGFVAADGGGVAAHVSRLTGVGREAFERDRESFAKTVSEQEGDFVNAIP